MLHLHHRAHLHPRLHLLRPATPAHAAYRAGVEVIQADYLRRYIRDPQSLRQWPQAKMPGFTETVINDSELDALLAYLRHMVTRKP